MGSRLDLLAQKCNWLQILSNAGRKGQQLLGCSPFEDTVSQAMRLFLSIMPAKDCIVTDHGVADFGSQFTTLCESLGIKHGGSTPRRSQAQGNIEVANRIFQNSLAKQCATANGRKTWEKFLPRSVQVINSCYPYKSFLSRVQLLMSSFYFCAGQLQPDFIPKTHLYKFKLTPY